MTAGKRIVVDTNTIVSGILLPQSVPGRLLGFLAGHATLIFSPATRDELLGVIAREKFDRYVAAEARERAVIILVRDSEMVAPRRLFHICRDPKDDKFLDAALAGRVDFLISGDADLITLGEFEGIPILTAARYLAGILR
ncbi:MAG: putative toxin-antitoxin system toxin component, PIN family [Betaproteobacteria bacterium]|nr:putative toxin-antitoxin system toxin component, PIN family [Betaproteobacteria bacterium]